MNATITGITHADNAETILYNCDHPFNPIDLDGGPGGILQCLYRYQRSIRIAVKVDTNVAANVVPTISVGSAELKFMRIAMTVVGISVTLDVFRASNVHIAGEAVSLSGFSFCNSCIALMPMGVAALPNPNMLALKLDIIYPNAG